MAGVANETVAQALDNLYTDFANWWQYKFPVAIVIFLTICGVGWVVGKFVEKVLLLRLSDEDDGWKHLSAEFVESSEKKNWLPWKWQWKWWKKSKESNSTLMNTVVQHPVNAAAGLAALPTRSVWTGNLTKDGARISGYLVMIGIDLAGAIIALEKAGISLVPLVVTGGVSALAISLSLRNLLGNLFAGVLLMFYDTCRAGCIVRFVPAPGVPTQDLRILTINLKHTLLMDVDEDEGDVLVLPNTIMLNPLYVKNMKKKLQDAEVTQVPIMGKTARADESISATVPRLRQTVRQQGLVL